MKTKNLFLAITLICIIFNQSFASTVNILRPAVNNTRYNGGSIDVFEANVTPQGTYAKVDLLLAFSAKGINIPDGIDSLEVEFKFQLEDNSFISDAWLDFFGTWIQADIFDMWTASTIYEEAVHRAHRIDPLLIKKIDQTNFSMNIYPLIRDTNRMIKFTYYTPIKFNIDNNAYIKLPFEFLKISTNPTESIKINILENNDFINSKIFEIQNKIYNEKQNMYYQPITEQGISGQTIFLSYSDITDSIYVKYDSPQKNGIFLTTSFEEDENYFQVAMKPINDARPVVPKKVVFLIDYNQSKSNIQKSDLLNGIKSIMKETFEPTDKFQVYLADDNVIMLNNDWVLATPENINNMFNDFNLDTILDKTKLFEMLMNSVDFINANHDTAVIQIISSTDDDGSKDRANQIIYSLQKTIHKSTKIFAAAFVTQNLKSYQIGSLKYAANDYLYRNLTQLTGGVFNKIQDNGNNINSLIKNSVNLFMQSISDFDINMEFKDGFGYSIYMSSDLNKLTTANQSVTGVGKYIGELPFSLKVHGFYRDTPFFYNNEVTSENLSHEIYNTRLIWTAKKIRELEQLPNQNSVTKHDIIMPSLYNRILSLYTAFLAIDPNLNDTTQHNDEDDPNTDVDDNSFDMNNENITVLISPNPFVDLVTITLNLRSIGLKNSIMTVQIFDVDGNLIKDFPDLSTDNNNNILLSWNGLNNKNQLVPNGMYFLVIKTKYNKYLSKILIQR